MKNNILIFCPCSESIEVESESASSTNIKAPRTIYDPNTLHDLPDLYFCVDCKTIKCRRCTEPEIECKYCSNCMNASDEDSTYCSKNCFVCPICNSNIIINSLVDDETSYKSYKFKCSYCDFAYISDPSEKPKSLSRIIKSKSNHNDLLKDFSNLETFYMNEKKPRFNKEMLLKLSNLQLQNLSKFGQPNHHLQQNSFIKVKFNEDKEIEQVGKFSSLKNVHDLISFDQQTKSNNFVRYKSSLLPLPRKLQSKNSLKCKSCRNKIIKPDEDPISIKFYKSLNAIDYLPQLRISPLINEKIPPIKTDASIKLIINITNPMLYPIELHISTFSTVPGKWAHKVRLPVAKVKLGAKPEKVNKPELLVKTIPSVYLTQNTKFSRGELINRIGHIKLRDDAPYDQGLNWCSLPVNIQVAPVNVEGQRLDIPFFVGVESDDLKFGFWCMIDFGSIEKS